MINEILVVDGLHETEEVLKTVLEPRGLNVNRIPSSGLNDYRQKSSAPQLVILHEDSNGPNEEKESDWNHCSKVIIGRAEIPASNPAESQKSRFLQNPFQYHELIHAIENLLDQ